MNIQNLHGWNLTPKEAVQVQKQLQLKVVTTAWNHTPKLVAGADASLDKSEKKIYAAVVLLSFPSLEVVETVTHCDHLSFPYIPGLLSFREAPALLKAFQKLKHNPDVIFTDGHGLAHPRSFGIGCHLGVCLNKPVIGCAKSLLCGHYQEPAMTRGSVSYLQDKRDHIIGAVVRTRDHVRPIFVSVGHHLSLEEAIEFTLSCGKGYRIPEPTRLADQLAAQAKRR